MRADIHAATTKRSLAKRRKRGREGKGMYKRKRKKGEGGRTGREKLVKSDDLDSPESEEEESPSRKRLIPHGVAQGNAYLFILMTRHKPR